MDNKDKAFRDAQLNGYKGSMDQFMRSYYKDAFHNDNGSMAAEKTETENEPIIRELKVSRSVIEDDDKILGLTKPVFYGAVAVVVIVLIAIGIYFMRKGKAKVVTNPGEVKPADAPADAMPNEPKK